MIIREAFSWDVWELYNVICLLENRRLNREEFNECYRNQHNNENMHCIVAEENGRMIGCLNLRIEYQLHHAGKIAEIMEFCIVEGQRSAGVGKKILDYAVLLAKKAGCDKIELCTNQLRVDAHRFYQRQGMKNFHYKFSMNLNGEEVSENRLGV